MFATGLSVVAVLLVVTWTLNWRYHMSALPPDDIVYRSIAFVAFFAGVMSNLGLPVLVRGTSVKGVEGGRERERERDEERAGLWY